MCQVTRIRTPYPSRHAKLSHYPLLEGRVTDYSGLRVEQAGGVY
jgi:hypothetical protein